MTNATATGTVVDTKHAGTSNLGNPAYWVTLDNGETYRTSANVMLAYGITNAVYRNEPHVFTLTAAGRIRSAMTIPRYLATTDGKDARAREIHNARKGDANG